MRSLYILLGYTAREKHLKSVGNTEDEGVRLVIPLTFSLHYIKILAITVGVNSVQRRLTLDVLMSISRRMIKVREAVKNMIRKHLLLH